MCLSERLEEKQLYLQVSEEVKEQIVNQGYDANFGARPLKRFIQHEIETLVARYILSENPEPNTNLILNYESNNFKISSQKK